jgi:hypothetical protein
MGKKVNDCFIVLEMARKKYLYRLPGTYCTVCQKPKMLPVRIFPAVYVLNSYCGSKRRNMKDCRLKWHKIITSRLFFLSIPHKQVHFASLQFICSFCKHICCTVPLTLYRKSDLCIPRYGRQAEVRNVQICINPTDQANSSSELKRVGFLRLLSFIFPRMFCSFTVLRKKKENTNEGYFQ